jgi:hypothetical protein
MRSSEGQNVEGGVPTRALLNRINMHFLVQLVLHTHRVTDADKPAVFWIRQAVCLFHFFIFFFICQKRGEIDIVL